MHSAVVQGRGEGVECAGAILVERVHVETVGNAVGDDEGRGEREESA